MRMRIRSLRRCCPCRRRRPPRPHGTWPITCGTDACLLGRSRTSSRGCTSGRRRRGWARGVPLAGGGRRDWGGRGFVLGDYENNSVKRRRAECERISGLLDRILEAATMLEDREEGGSLSSPFKAAADRCGRMAMSDEDNQRRFTAEPLLASTQRERASDLRPGRDAIFRRRVDGLLAKNCTRGDGIGGDDNNGGSPIGRATIHRRQRPRPRASETANRGGGTCDWEARRDGDQCSRRPRRAIPAT
jgi:hypothetical protein